MEGVASTHRLLYNLVLMLESCPLFILDLRDGCNGSQTIKPRDKMPLWLSTARRCLSVRHTRVLYVNGKRYRQTSSSTRFLNPSAVPSSNTVNMRVEYSHDGEPVSSHRAETSRQKPLRTKDHHPLTRNITRNHKVAEVTLFIRSLDTFVTYGAL